MSPQGTTPMPLATRRKGFTLIELVVASTVALLVFGAASQMLILLNISRRVAFARAELARDATMAMGWLRRDIHAGGRGAINARDRIGSTGYDALLPAVVPNETARSATGTPSFSTATLSPSGGSTGFTLIADIPRPDSLVDGVSMLPDRPHTTTVLYPTNELTGRRTQADSGNRRHGGLRYDVDCTSTTPMAAGALGCPWGLGKYRPTSNLNNVQVIYPNGEWEERTISTLNAPSNGADTGITLGTALTNAATALVTPFASGMVVQLDRVGYLFDQGTRRLYRRQCWATPLAGGSAAIGFQMALGGTAPNCSSSAHDTGWLPVARNLDITATTITLRDANNAAATSPANIQSIEVDLVLTNNVRVGSQVRKVSIRLRERFFMRSVTG